MSIADQIALVAAVVAFVSAVISVAAIYLPWRNTHDSEIFKEAVLALERAYRAITLDKVPGELPSSDRINWLTAARHVQSFKALQDSLKTELYRRLCREHEGHWRHEFYLLILKKRIYQRAYFEGGPIEPRSALVIFGFAAWPHAEVDLIDKVDIEELLKASPVLEGNYGLREYLAKFPQYAGIAAP